MVTPEFAIHQQRCLLLKFFLILAKSISFIGQRLTRTTRIHYHQKKKNLISAKILI